MISVIGENVIDLLSQTDGSFRASVGGSPLNVAVGVARAQVPSCYLSPLSLDAMGQRIEQQLLADGVQLPSDNRSSCPTSLAFVTFDANGQPHYSLYRQGIADRDTSAEHLLAVLPKATKILHTGSLALEPQDAEQLLPVLKAAKAWGMWLSIDLNVRLAFVSDAADYRRYLLELIPLADIIKASDEDLEHLFGEGDALASLQTLNPHALIAYTTGADGAELRRGEEHLFAKSVPAVPFVDTVGAGDTFFANLLASLLPWHGQTLPKVSDLRPQLQRANLAASLNVRKAGCQPPSKTELDTAYAELYGAK
jgi:fructokinase